METAWTRVQGFTCDCDDGDSGVYPRSQEVVGNGVDEDCDGDDALVRKTMERTFPVLAWTRTGAVSSTSDGVQVGGPLNSGSVSRAYGDVWVGFYQQFVDETTPPHSTGVFRTLDGGASWEYQGAGVANTNAYDEDGAGNQEYPWCKDLSSLHEAKPFGDTSLGDQGNVFNGGSESTTLSLTSSWGNVAGLAAINQLAAVAAFQSYTTTSAVDGRLAYTLDGGESWSAVTFRRRLGRRPVDHRRLPSLRLLPQVEGRRPRPPRRRHLRRRHEQGWERRPLAARLLRGLPRLRHDGRVGRPLRPRPGDHRRDDGDNLTWFPLDRDSTTIDCEVDEENMRGVATMPWSDEVAVWGFYDYDAGAHAGGACLIDIDDPATVTELVDPAVYQVSIADVAPAPFVNDLLLVAPYIDAGTWIECHETGAGDCPDLPYPKFAERAAGNWTLSTITSVPPSLVATSAGWTDLNDPLRDPALLYATEGAGAWRGTLSW